MCPPPPTKKKTQESEPISHKNPQFKANYPLDDACFILDYYACNK